MSKNSKIIGLDQSKSAIKYIKSLELKNVEVIEKDITKDLSKLGFKFDFISCDQVLHHTPDPAKTLNNFSKVLNKNGIIHFFVCNKKNKYRDFVDDLIMHNARKMKPEDLWKFSKVVTDFGRSLAELNIKNITFEGKRYSSIQNFVHNQIFRCWYNKDIDFDLSVSSNYDWFSNNPRYSKLDVMNFLKQVKGLKVKNVYEDDACVAVVAKVLINVRYNWNYK